MKLSVIIVNYNVKFFLRQTLQSVFRSKTSFNFEVIVIDNASIDGSVSMVVENFKEVKIISNQENVGFAKANNQGIRMSHADYVLLLNPDTIIEEDTLEKTVLHLEKNNEIGGLGVYMVDGKGIYLPESKRGFPSPSAAFYKLFGLSKLFPTNKTFGQYHLTYLDKDKLQNIDVLSGAFMLLRKSALDKVGLLDEDYFMYGEDIDLSYRLQQGGYQNCYFPNTKIIHFKGESTKKGNLNYVKIFYQAMIIFSKKHLKNNNAFLLVFILKAAIYFRAFLAYFEMLVSKYVPKIFDAFFLYTVLTISLYVLKHTYHVNDGIVYPNSVYYINIPIYITIWLLSMYYCSAYDKPYRFSNLLAGLLIGTLFIAAIYGFFPAHLRSSRGMILMGFAGGLFVLWIYRWISILRNKRTHSEHKEFIVVGTFEEYLYLKKYLREVDKTYKIKGFVASDSNEESHGECLGTLSTLVKTLQMYPIDEVIFCQKSIAAKDIIYWIQLIPDHISCKIASDDLIEIIGSNSKNTQGEIYTFDFNFNIRKPFYLRLKRLQDRILALIFLLFSPILILLVKNKTGFLKNIIYVLLGKIFWVGFQPNMSFYYDNISGILSPLGTKTFSDKQQEKMLITYARNFNILVDLMIIFKNFNLLGLQHNAKD